MSKGNYSGDQLAFEFGEASEHCGVVRDLKPCRPRNFSKRNRRALCGGCGVDTLALDHWYMVKDEVWEQAWPGTSNGKGELSGQGHFLCISCLEERLGRKLTRDDFDDCPLNHEQRISGRSGRMIHRLISPPRSQAEAFRRRSIERYFPVD